MLLRHFMVLFACALSLKAHGMERNLDHDLIDAAKVGKIGLFSRLLKEGANINARDALYQATALHFAVGFRHSMFLQYLIESTDIDVNAVNKFGSTALAFAAFQNDLESVKILLQSGKIKLDIQNHEGSTALHYAVTMGNREMTKLLLVKGARTDLDSRGGKVNEIARKIHPELLDLFEDRPQSDMSSFLEAVYWNNPRRIKELSKKEFDFNQIIGNGGAAIHYAIAAQAGGSFWELLKAPNFNINTRNALGSTPLMFTLECLYIHHLTFGDALTNLRLLLKAPGIDLDVVNYYGYTAIVLTALINPELVSLLLDKGAKMTPRALANMQRQIEASNAGSIVPSITVMVAPPPAIADDNSKLNNTRFLAMPPGNYELKELIKAVVQRLKHDLKEQRSIDRTCAQCKKVEGCTKYCSRCHKVYYCSKECQVAHWKAHKAKYHKPQECTICFEMVEDGKEERCGHQFHEGCIEGWKATKGTCPVCKAYL